MGVAVAARAWRNAPIGTRTREQTLMLLLLLLPAAAHHTAAAARAALRHARSLVERARTGGGARVPITPPSAPPTLRTPPA